MYVCMHACICIRYVIHIHIINVHIYIYTHTYHIHIIYINMIDCTRTVYDSRPSSPFAVLGAGPASALPEGEDAVGAFGVAHHAEELGPGRLEDDGC